MIRKSLKYLLVFFIGVTISFPVRNKSLAYPVVLSKNTPPAIMTPHNVDVNPDLVLSDKAVKAGLLYDMVQNKVVWQKGMYGSLPIASLTKLMTVLLILEDIQNDKICWDTEVRATPEASLIGSTKLWMKPGQVFTVHDLVKSAIISSANDASYLLAQVSGGTEKSFVSRMNEKAVSLRMFNTYFTNTTGLPAPRYQIDNFSSPHDLLILAREVLKNEKMLEIASLNNEYVYAQNQKFVLKNHNKLAVEYTEVDGLKTGYTRNAGFCIVATAQKESNRLIAIALGATSPGSRNDFVAQMFNAYYDNILCIGKLVKTDPPPYVPKKTITKHKSRR